MEPLSPVTPARPRRGRTLTVVGAVVLVAAVAVASLWAVWRAVTPGLTEAEVDRAVTTTLTRESEESFLVTGTLEFGTTVERQNTQLVTVPLVPFDVEIGETRVMVRVPGRVGYGFDVRQVGPNSIRLAEDGTVEVDLPQQVVFSVEPILERAEVRTDASGWARVDPARGARVTANALASARTRMREQAQGHLARAREPRINAARAVARMLTPALLAAGAPAPRFRMRVGGGETLELDGEVLVGGS